MASTLGTSLVTQKARFPTHFENLSAQLKPFRFFGSLTFILGVLASVKTWSHMEVQERVSRVPLTAVLETCILVQETEKAEDKLH